MTTRRTLENAHIHVASDSLDWTTLSVAIGVGLETSITVFWLAAMISTADFVHWSWAHGDVPCQIVPNRDGRQNTSMIE